MAWTPRATYKTLNPSSTPASIIQGSVAMVAGDLVIVGYYLNGALASATISDTGGNTWAEVGSGVWAAGGDGLHLHVFYCKAQSTGTYSITCNGTGIWAGLITHVGSGMPKGLSTILVQSALVGELTTRMTHNSGTVTVPDGSHYLFCFWGEVSGERPYTENGQGFTLRQYELGVGSNDRTVSAAGTYFDSVTTTANAYYASILCAFSGDSDGIDLGGSAKGSSVLQAALSTSIALGAALASASATQAALSTSIPLSSSISSDTTTRATLTTGKPLSSSLRSASAVQAALTTGKPLTAGLSSLSTLQASLNTSIALAGSVSSRSEAQAALTSHVALEGSLAAHSALQAALTTQELSQLSAAMSSVSSIQAALTTSLPLSGALGSSSSMQAALTTSLPLSGSISSGSFFTAQLASLSASIPTRFGELQERRQFIELPSITTSAELSERTLFGETQ